MTTTSKLLAACLIVTSQLLLVAMATYIDVRTLDSDHLITDDASTVCRHVSSQWSTCSKQCGIGISYRVSNHLSPDCQIHREKRLCYIRPCQGTERYLPAVSVATVVVVVVTTVVIVVVDEFGFAFRGV